MANEEAGESPRKLKANARLYYNMQMLLRWHTLIIITIQLAFFCPSFFLLLVIVIACMYETNCECIREVKMIKIRLNFEIGCR